MNNTNVITWFEIEDRMKSMIGEFLEFYEIFYLFIPEYTWELIIDEDIEKIAELRVLEWLNNAWKILVKSGMVNYSTQTEYFQALLYCISLFYRRLPNSILNQQHLSSGHIFSRQTRCQFQGLLYVIKASLSDC